MRNCSVERTLSILSDAWTFLVLREFYLGARRFEQICVVLKIPRSTLSDRLNRLVDCRILKRVSQGNAHRHEYRLTPAGLDLYAVMLALLRFGDDRLRGKKRPPIELVHQPCGHVCHPETLCSACGQPVHARNVSYRDGPGAGRSRPDVPHRRRTGAEDKFQRGRPDSVARTLGILADRWTFLILREMFFGRRRYDDFLANLGVATNTLADRLNRLVEQGMLKRVKYSDLPVRYEYRLTDRGFELYLPLIQMLRWGDLWLGFEPPLILRHTPCGKDFVPIVACSHCRQALEAHAVSYRLNYEAPSSLGVDHAGPSRVERRRP